MGWFEQLPRKLEFYLSATHLLFEDLGCFVKDHGEKYNATILAILGFIKFGLSANGEQHTDCLYDLSAEAQEILLGNVLLNMVGNMNVNDPFFEKRGRPKAEHFVCDLWEGINDFELADMEADTPPDVTEFLSEHDSFFSKISADFAQWSSNHATSWLLSNLIQDLSRDELAPFRSFLRSHGTVTRKDDVFVTKLQKTELNFPVLDTWNERIAERSGILSESIRRLREQKLTLYSYLVRLSLQSSNNDEIIDAFKSKIKATDRLINQIKVHVASFDQHSGVRELRYLRHQITSAKSILKKTDLQARAEEIKEFCEYRGNGNGVAPSGLIEFKSKNSVRELMGCYEQEGRILHQDLIAFYQVRGWLIDLRGAIGKLQRDYQLYCEVKKRVEDITTVARLAGELQNALILPEAQEIVIQQGFLSGLGNTKKQADARSSEIKDKLEEAKQAVIRSIERVQISATAIFDDASMLIDKSNNDALVNIALLLRGIAYTFQSVIPEEQQGNSTVGSPAAFFQDRFKGITRLFKTYFIAREQYTNLKQTATSDQLGAGDALVMLKMSEIAAQRKAEADSAKLSLTATANAITTKYMTKYEEAEQVSQQLVDKWLNMIEARRDIINYVDKQKAGVAGSSPKRMRRSVTFGNVHDIDTQLPDEGLVRSLSGGYLGSSRLNPGGSLE